MRLTKKIMTAKEFQKKMEGMGLTVEDQTSSAKDSTYHDYELDIKRKCTAEKHLEQ